MELFEKIEGAAKLIGLTPSAVKKYYLLFEQEGYKFKRSNEGHVLFSPQDIELLKKLILLKNEPSMTVIKAVKKLVKEIVITDTTDITVITNDITVISKQVMSVMTELKEIKSLVKNQEQIISDQQKYIEESLNNRDKLLMQSIREQQDIKKLILDTQKQIAADLQAKEESKKKWWQFWKS